LEGLSIGYAPGHPLLADLNLELHVGQRVVLAGPNGSGKTTLLRTIHGEIEPLTGRVHLSSTLRLGYLTQDQAGLRPDRSAVENLQGYFANETEVRNFLAYYLFTGDEPLKLVSMLSYGQRSRLLLAMLVAGGCNCLMLDEPINHLDISSRTQFERALGQFDGAVLVVVHDRYFIQRFAEEIWWIEDGNIHRKWELPQPAQSHL